MAVGAAAPWDTCAADGCEGVRFATFGRCLAHAPPEALAAHLAAAGPGVDLDGRGVCFTRSATARLLEAIPRDELGRPALGAVRLDQATFEHAVSFDDATFAGEVSMTGTTFRGDARFGGASFLGPVDCCGASFAGQAWFLGASFAGPVSFAGVTFGGAAWFQRASFAHPATFDGALFAASLTIADARFAGTAAFTGAVFDGHVRAERASCEGGWRVDGARFRYEDEGPVPAAQRVDRSAVPAAVAAAIPAQVPPGVPLTAPPRAKRGCASGRRARRIGGLVLPLGVLVAIAVVGVILFRPVADVDPDIQPKVTSSAHIAFLHRQLETNHVTRYDPCRPVRFVVNERSGPPGWTSLLSEVMREVSELSGITFQFDGVTDEPIRADVQGQLKRAYGWPRNVEGYADGYQDLFKRPSYQPARYGPDRWAPVLIGWTSFGRVDAGYGRHIAGVGASEPRETAAGTVYVSGALVLNSDAGMDLRPTLMHELGHVLGLAHVGSPDEIMHARQRGQTSWGPGDKEGLRAVGREAGCLETPAPG